MKNEKKKRAIRYSAFVIAAILAIGSFSVWAMNTQATTTADVTISGAPAGLNVNGNDGTLITNGVQGRPGSVETIDPLFDVEQQDSDYYSGNYEVTVYLANTDYLVDHFRYLNIELDVVDAEGNELEDDETLGYITLENGRLSFTVTDDDVSGGTMDVSIVGGSFLATSDGAIEDAEFLIDISEGSSEEPVSFDTA